ncbi:type II secretion system F family protein [Streptomyces sp. ODS28]|uniref:type II secretion system F family protein n=1 Tax=Streptomyces sp. ODS28 TaxID=3136688 RepID=UPI0031E8F83A
MIAVMLLAAGAGAGLWALVVYLFPPRAPLSEMVARLHAVPSRPPIALADEGGWSVRIGAPFTGLLRALGLPGKAMRKDLAVTGRSIETHLAEMAVLALTGLLLPTLVELALVLGGRPLPWPVPTAVALAFALGGFLLPGITVRTAAQQRRTAFRHALSGYLNLIHILLAGGAGVDAALHDAAATGRGWAFQQLRRALTTARLTRTSPWASLEQLGEELDIHELTELSAALSLAGTEGSKIRASLAAKAAAMRAKEGSEAEGRANAATERMALPAMLMAIGFVLFVFYPALSQISASL